MGMTTPNANASESKSNETQSALPLEPKAEAKGAEGTPDSKAAEAKADESKGSPYAKEAKPDEKQPDVKPVDLELPKDFDAQAGATLKTLAGQLGLDAAKGKVLVDAYVAAQASAQKSYEERLAKQTDAWKATLKEDAAVKAAGGFDASMRLVDRLVTRFDPKGELSDVLERSGLAFHPAVVHFFTSIATTLKEDSVAGTTPAPAKDADPLAALRAQYPNHPQLSKE